MTEIVSTDVYCMQHTNIVVDGEDMEVYQVVNLKTGVIEIETSLFVEAATVFTQSNSAWEQMQELHGERSGLITPDHSIITPGGMH